MQQNKELPNLILPSIAKGKKIKNTQPSQTYKNRPTLDGSKKHRKNT